MSDLNVGTETKKADELIAKHLLGCTMIEIRDRSRAMLKEYAEWHTKQKVNDVEKPTSGLTIPVVVERSEQLKAEQEAYDKGYNDGAQAAANDILN